MPRPFKISAVGQRNVGPPEVPTNAVVFTPRKGKVKSYRDKRTYDVLKKRGCLEDHLDSLMAISEQLVYIDEARLDDVMNAIMDLETRSGEKVGTVYLGTRIFREFRKDPAFGQKIAVQFEGRKNADGLRHHYPIAWVTFVVLQYADPDLILPIINTEIIPHKV